MYVLISFGLHHDGGGPEGREEKTEAWSAVPLLSPAPLENATKLVPQVAPRLPAAE